MYTIFKPTHFLSLFTILPVAIGGTVGGQRRMNWPMSKTAIYW